MPVSPSRNTPSAHIAAGTAVVTQPPARRKRVWLEIELVFLILLVVGVYFTRLTDLTIRGEESRWARVAHEMVATGDWIVPRQQGQPFPDRPPLNSWAMIAASRATGGLDLTAIRLPAVIATLLVTLAIYVYCRNFLSRLGALAAAAAYPTMAQVLQLGRVGESDALLTLCVAAALFAWHYCYACRDRAASAWIIGYALAALAGLAKGPQGPIYFVAITSVFLAQRRDWRFLFSPWQLAGLAVFLAIVGAWQLPFYWELGGTSAQAVWSEGGEMSDRFDYTNLPKVLGNWIAYPFEVFACLLPWSLMLFAVPTRWMRSRLGEARPMVEFLATAIAVAFVTCWLPAQSRARYFMCLYPAVAPLVGLSIQRCWECREKSWWQQSWDRYLIGGAVLTAAVGVLVAATQFGQGSGPLHLREAVSHGFALAFVPLAAIAASLMIRLRPRQQAWQAQAAVLTLAAFMGLTYTGVVVSVQTQTSNHPWEAIARVRELIPPGERLMSFGQVHHLFAYYYGEPIELQKLGKSRRATPMSGSYFCFAVDPHYTPPIIPFEWETVAEISCERTHSPHPANKVVVGRRKSSLAQTEHAPANDDPHVRSSADSDTAALQTDTSVLRK
jgi:4-amino-4-deoxy-L-arabinose transferase-like glycosyltransferase